MLLLEHVGSTSVPGLAAKPVIDMMLVVADSSDEGAYVPDLEDRATSSPSASPTGTSTGCLKGPDTNVNLHMFSEGCSEVERMVAFRDWLRTHDDDRELYESAKRELAAQRVEVRAELRGREVGRRRATSSLGRRRQRRLNEALASLERDARVAPPARRSTNVAIPRDDQGIQRARDGRSQRDMVEAA